MANDDRSPRALAISQPHADLPSETEWQIIQRMSNAFNQSGLYSNIKDVAQAIAIVQTGRELGVPPAAALRSFAIIGGKPTASAEMLAALIYRDHGDRALRVVESTSERCTIEYRRRSWDAPGRLTFTMEDAQLAGLGKRSQRNPNEPSNWEKFPRAMLRSRAISEAARTAFQDSILGMYTAEELAPDQVTVTDEGEIVVVPTAVEAEPEPAKPATTEGPTAPRFGDPAVIASINKTCTALYGKVPASLDDYNKLLGRYKITLANKLPISIGTLRTLLGKLNAELANRPAVAANAEQEPVEGEIVDEAPSDDGAMDRSAAFVKWENVIATATARHEVIAALEDAALELDADESAQLDKIGEARFESLPEEELVEA